jgi:hypothetical protein
VGGTGVGGRIKTGGSDRHAVQAYHMEGEYVNKHGECGSEPGLIKVMTKRVSSDYSSRALL